MNLSLSEALKYAAGEQEAFEKRIDENPFDSDNHLIYADWLDDQGHSQEAAFRRAMGEWVRKGEHNLNDASDGEGKSFGVWSHSIIHPYWARRTNLPEWAEGVVSVGSNVDRKHPSEAILSPNGRGLSWSSYRAMEEGLRRAFNIHTQGE